MGDHPWLRFVLVLAGSIAGGFALGALLAAVIGKRILDEVGQ